MAEKRSHKTSRRLQLACEPCKAGKLKCDRSLPVCEQCYKRSREAVCKYTEKGLRYNSSARTSETIKEKIERLEALVDSLKDRNSHSERGLFVKVAEPPGSRGGGRESCSQMGNFKFERSGSTQWIGPSHWESVVDDVADLKTHFEEESQELQMSSANSTTPAVNVSFPDAYFTTQQISTQRDLLDHIPQRSEMDRYLAAWFNVMDPTRIIVHAPTFQQQCECFWLNPQSAEPAWIALLLATCGLGAEISGQSLVDQSILARADLLRKLTSCALVLINPTSPQRWLIECLVLYITGLLFSQHDATAHIWQLIGLTIRLFHQAGYHRDPSKVAKFSPFACEMRRRTWLVACELGISVSNTLGMVSSVNYDLCDTHPPSNLTEADFSPEHCDPPRSYEECTLVQVEVCFARLVRILGDIVISSHAVVTPSRSQIDGMDQRLNQARDQLPKKLKLKPLDRSFIDSPTETIDRLRLEFTYQKALCILYRRFLSEQSFEQERQKCMDAAQAIVQHSIAMLIAARPGGQLASLKILLMRHVHEFTLVAMLICYQLVNSSDQGIGVTGDFSLYHMRPKLLQACQLWDFPGLQSPKARAALNAITKLLQGEPLDSPTKHILSDGEGFGSDVAFTAVPCLDLFDPHAGFETSARSCPVPSENPHSRPEVMFDAMFDAESTLFDDMAATRG